MNNARRASLLLIASGLVSLIGLYLIVRGDGEEHASEQSLPSRASEVAVSVPSEVPPQVAAAAAAAASTTPEARPTATVTQPADAVTATSPPTVAAATSVARTPVPERVSIEGTYTRFEDFPGRFFEESVVSIDQIIKVLDAQFQSLRKLHGGIAPYPACLIEYDATHYGSTTPLGIRLGDAAFPSRNGGHPRWEVMAHEQGHNFFGGTSRFYYFVAVPGPLLQESLAVLSAFYTYADLKANQQTYGLTTATMESLAFDFGNGRAYQEGRYREYLRLGRPFNDADVLTSQALDFKMISYAEQYGWANIERLARAFSDGLASRFTFQADGVTGQEQSTYIVAALSAAFGRDFRVDFHELNFPIDPQLFSTVFQVLAAYLS